MLKNKTEGPVTEVRLLVYYCNPFLSRNKEGVLWQNKENYIQCVEYNFHFTGLHPTSLAKSQKCHKKWNNSESTDFRKKHPLVISS